MPGKRSHGEGSITYRDDKKLWVAQVTLPNGKRKTKYGKTQKLVRDWLLSQREAIGKGSWVESDAVTYGAFLDRYLADVAAHTLRPKTLESYSYLIRMHIRPELGGIRLPILRPEHVQALYSAKLAAGLSRRTVHFIHSVIHRTLAQAVRWGLVVRNVADMVDAPSVKKSAPAVWSSEEASRFLDSVREHRYYPVYVLALTTGMREGEILGLHVEDIDWAGRAIHVQHAAQTLAGKGVIITEPKTEKARRSITLPQFALQVLRDHLDREVRPGGLVFVTKTGRPVWWRNVVRHFKSAIAEAGLPDIRFHDLRHTCASLHLAMGTHPSVVQALLGHSSITLTLDTYSHVLPGVQAEAADKMDKLFCTSKVHQSR